MGLRLSFKSLIIALLLLIAPLAKADTMSDLLGKMDDISHDVPVMTVVDPGSVGAILCDFRGVMTGTVGMVIVATSIFICGLYTIIGKMKPLYAILIIGFSVVLINPELISKKVVYGMFTQNAADLFFNLCINYSLDQLTE